MPLEEAVQELTKELKTFNANFAKGGGGGGAPATAAPGRGPGRPKKITLDAVKAIAEKVRDVKGRPAAVALISQHGAKALGDLDESKYAAFVAACEVALAEEEGEEEAGADESL